MADRSLEARFAPDIDPEWAEEFILEARLRDVPGERIGDALGDVNAHCRDSGESAVEAFGDPAEYARTIAAQSTPVRTNWVALLGPNAVQVIGVVLVLHGVGGWATGETYPLDWGVLGLSALLGGGVLLVGVALSRFLGVIVRRTALAAVTGGAVGAVLMAGASLLLLIDTPAVRVPTAGVLAIGVVVLAVGIGIDVAIARSGATDDPIVAPGVAPQRGRPRLIAPWVAPVWIIVGSIVIVLFA